MPLLILAELILENQTLKFTNPRDFNDPFDCNMAILEFSRTNESIEDYKKDIDSHNLPRKVEREFLREFVNDPRVSKKLYNHIIEERLSHPQHWCAFVTRATQYISLWQIQKYADKSVRA